MWCGAGDLYSARNLDWLPDLGVNKYKLLTVHHPPGAVPHVTIGYAGIWGALAGMSAAGADIWRHSHSPVYICTPIVE
jgi:hypothetical protein